jgi:hypothetical protein
MGSYNIYWLSKIRKGEHRTVNFLCTEVRVMKHDMLWYVCVCVHTHMHLCKHSHTTVFSDFHTGSILCGHFAVKSQITSRRIQIFMAKVELLPYLIKHNATKTYGEMAVQLHTLLSIAVCISILSASCPKTLTFD